jgi:hypothetical protein
MAMIGRWRFRAFVALSVAAILFAAVATLFVLLRPVPEVSLTGMSRLRLGMTEAEVAANLGAPTGDLTAAPPAGVPAPPSGGKLLEYTGAKATARVEFGPDGRMARCDAASIRTVSGLERVRIRLNWW